MFLKPFFKSLIFLFFLFLCTCEDGINLRSTPLLTVNPSSLVIGFPSEGNYTEGVVQLVNEGGADVIVTSLTFREDGDRQELTLLDAEDWSGRVIIGPQVIKEVRIAWRLLDAQPNTGEIRIESNAGNFTIPVSTDDPDPELLVEVDPSDIISSTSASVPLNEAIPGSFQRARIRLLSIGSNLLPPKPS